MGSCPFALLIWTRLFRENVAERPRRGPSYAAWRVRSVIFCETCSPMRTDFSASRRVRCAHALEIFVHEFALDGDNVVWRTIIL